MHRKKGSVVNTVLSTNPRVNLIEQLNQKEYDNTPASSSHKYKSASEMLNNQSKLYASQSSDQKELITILGLPEDMPEVPSESPWYRPPQKSVDIISK